VAGRVAVTGAAVRRVSAAVPATAPVVAAWAVAGLVLVLFAACTALTLLTMGFQVSG
jgi:hypothetical protein